MDGPRKRPSWDEYFMTIAYDVASRSNCLRRSVGAVIVKGRNIISTGYNGTPIGVQDCFDGGCPRCQSDAPSHTGYDTCICVHAEENAIAFAARHGTQADESVMYTTLRPCLGCLKLCVQAGIREIVYSEGFQYEEELEVVYRQLVEEAGLRMRQLKLERKEA
ncbi:MAG: dCMP deaminase family protein [Chloroflexi bacterium]|nr:dCMP deaminase family protein [Chloroflexota bacterium]